MLYQFRPSGSELRVGLDSQFQCEDRKCSSSSGSFSDAYQSLSPTMLASSFQAGNYYDHININPGLDDSLTNLNWLHNVNPTKINEQLSRVPPMAPPMDRFPPSQSLPWYVRPKATSPPPRQATTTHDQLDYRNNPNLKPPFSYAILISWAMRQLGKPKITLSDIYAWIVENFAYYRQADSSWQNSIRHNLSLGKCFEKVPRRKDEPGKGGFWRINPQHAKTLEMNLSKVKYDPSRPLKSEDPYQKRSQPTKSVSNLCSPSSLQAAVPSATKRPRKSPITVTKEDWDHAAPFSYHTQRSLERSEGLSLVDDSSHFNNNIDFDLSPFDNSSSDSFKYNSSSQDDLPFHGTGLDDILNDSMSLYKEDLSQPDDFLPPTTSDHFSGQFFTSSRDDLEDLNSLLGIF